MLNEFKAFIMRGNVVDLAVGIIIGAAFNKIVTSFVGDILTPILSLALGRVDFSNLFIALNGESYPTLEAAKAAGAATINLGLFANAVIDFLIMGFAVFMIIKMINHFHKKPAPPAPNTKDCPECFSSINLQAKRCPHCTAVLA